MTKSNLTQLPGVPDSGEVRPGMASWEGGGPYGRTCSQCVHKGYRRETGYISGACAMFKKLTGRHGPNVGGHWKACRYFEEGKG